MFSPCALSDDEIICTFMEPCPRHFGQHRPRHRTWWQWQNNHWAPIRLGLDELWLVEEVLLNSQEPAPDEFLSWGDCLDAAFDRGNNVQFPWHYPAEHKIHTLAIIIRPLLT